MAQAYGAELNGDMSNQGRSGAEVNIGIEVDRDLDHFLSITVTDEDTAAEYIAVIIADPTKVEEFFAAVNQAKSDWDRRPR